MRLTIFIKYWLRRLRRSFVPLLLLGWAWALVLSLFYFAFTSPLWPGVGEFLLAFLLGVGALLLTLGFLAES